ncbi:transaldolase family protein [Streptomyces sp. NPDC090036]|uniref:transaldolase family protein n=1 Tax=Streptomyces sp. NPDC090036 TaxID=3365926 RepID=UPI003809532F
MDVQLPGRRADAERTGMTTEPLKQLAAEGVSLWLEGVGHRRLSSGELTGLVTSHGVSGVSCAPHGPSGLLDRSDYRARLDELSSYGAGVAEAARALAARDVRTACDTLLPMWERSRGADGQVCAAIGHTRDVRGALAEARSLHWTVDRPNLLVRLPADPVGLATASDCLAEGIGVAFGPVYSAESYELVLEAWLLGLERAVAAGLAPGRIPAAVQVPVSEIDTAARALLSAHTGRTAEALRGRVAVAVARLVFSAYERRLDSPRWRELVRAGARPHRLVWSFDGEAADRLSGGLVAEGTVQSLTAEGLRTLSATVVLMEGDTLSGRVHSAREDLRLLADLGVDWEQRAKELGSESPHRQYGAWRELVDAVGAAMEQQTGR